MQRPSSRKKDDAVYTLKRIFCCPYSKINVQIPTGKTDYTIGYFYLTMRANLKYEDE